MEWITTAANTDKWKCTWEYAAHVTVTLANERVLVFVRTPEAGLGHCTWLNTEN